MKKNTKQMILGLIISLLGTFFYLSPPGKFLEEEYGLSILYQLRGPTTAPDNVIIIDIGTESAKKLGLMETQQDFPWPWPRNIYAQLIKRLHQAGAQVIVFDIIFNKPGPIPEHDKLLAKTMRDAGNVIVVERLQPPDTQENSSNTRSFRIITETSIPLIKEISAAVLAHTSFLLPKSKTNINAYWAFKPGMGDAPTIPAMVLQAYALETYNDLTALLHQVYPHDNTLSLLNLNPAADLELAMLLLRQLFINHPELGEEISIKLQQNITIDNRNKQLIQALINLYSGQDGYYLNFYGPPNTIKTIPYYQFLLPATGDKDPPDTVLKQVRNKVVFVGLTQSEYAENEKIRDAYPTVFTKGDIEISGVEIAATAFANLIENKPVKPVPNYVSLTLFVIIGFTLSFVFPILTSKIIVAASIIVAGIYTALAWLLFEQINFWSPLITPLLIILLASFGAFLLRHLIAKKERDAARQERDAARRERDQLLELFGDFTPERVVGDFTRHIDSSLRTDQLVFGACMFTDVQGYATLAGQMNLRQLRRLMNDYFQILSQSVKQNNGVVTEIIGDAMLAIWETTSANSTLRKQACQAGLIINRFSQQGDHPALPTRIGIHFGELLVTRLGTTDHTILGVIGNLVNTTSRIEGANKPLGTRLLVTDEVIDGIDDFLTRPLGNFQLAGCSQPVCLSELIDYQQQADNKQHVLCALFAGALTAYQQQQPAAIEHWQEILNAYPDDGPTKFYLNHCLKLPPEAWQPTIDLSKNS